MFGRKFRFSRILHFAYERWGKAGVGAVLVVGAALMITLGIVVTSDADSTVEEATISEEADDGGADDSTGDP